MSIEYTPLQSLPGRGVPPELMAVERRIGGTRHNSPPWNGVAARPLRLMTVEMLVQGRPANESTAIAAANLAVDGAQPLKFNAYKVPLMRDLVKRAILSQRI